jgi:uncharacterized membrane protein
MPERFTQSDVFQFFIKIIFPAFLAVGLKIAIEMKKTKSKISFLNVFLSMLIGVGGAYLSSRWVQSAFNEDFIPIVIALIAITSDKIGEFLIYKLNVDGFLTALIDAFIDNITNIKKK